MSRGRSKVKLLKSKPPAPAPLRIAVALACMDSVESGFATDLSKLMAYSTLALVAPGHADLQLNVVSSSLVSCSRNDLAGEALRTDCTHILWIDSDMRFPRNALVRLLNHRKAMVGINYSTRKVDAIDYVAFKTKGLTNDTHVKLKTLPDSTGLETVDAIGFGMVLIETNVFRGVAYPAFDVHYDLDKKMWIGEDVDFCEKVRANGVEIFVDHDLSKECAHTGRMDFYTSMVEQAKAVDPGLITREVVDPSPPLILEA
jgi:hypothetical protein